MRYLEITFTYAINGMEEKQRTFDIAEETEKDVQQMIAEAEQEQAEDERGEDEVKYSAEMVKILEANADLVPDEYNNLESIFDFAAAYSCTDQDTEVIAAALYLSIEPKNIDEAYHGSFNNDEHFAKETAEQCGEYNQRDERWPKNCIDWELAAKELMYDYCEQNGHYFRNL